MADPTMHINNPLSLFATFGVRIKALERSMSRRSNMLSFLVVRFVLMSGMAVGFSWWAFNLSP